MTIMASMKNLFRKAKVGKTAVNGQSVLNSMAATQQGWESRRVFLNSVEELEVEAQFAVLGATAVTKDGQRWIHMAKNNTTMQLNTDGSCMVLDGNCEIIKTFARSLATAAKVFATMPGMPCIPLPLIETRLTCRIEVTALTPRDDGCPSTDTRVPWSSG